MIMSNTPGNGQGPNGHASHRVNGNGSANGNGHGGEATPRVRRRAISGWSLITGGAGFIGTNLAKRLLASGKRVMIVDNLSRPGVEQNAQFLRSLGGERVKIEMIDVRDMPRLRELISHAEEVFHFAAQVAVTCSLVNPLHDFEVNARGTLNVLEAVRAAARPPRLLFTSTNKVYGALDRLALRRGEKRYEPADEQHRQRGVDEQMLDFHSPYGCSKGCADQYVIDYARTFNLPAAVFRMSCIYGPHQCGNEDQGWVAHFLIRAIENKPITIYGDGRQVRDILYVEDLTAAMCLAMERMNELAGQAFNMGGGPTRTISLVELLEIIEELTGRKPRIERGDWRPGDQRYYVSDTSRFEQATGWSAEVGVEDGVGRLHEWLLENRPQPGRAAINDVHAGAAHADESEPG
jgi:CDP-paratose 2-epimerase